MLHGLGIVPYIRKNGTFFKKARGYLLPPEHIHPAVSQGPEALRHHPSQSATVWAARTFLKTFVALVLLLQSQVRVYVGQSLLFLQDFLCLLAFLEHIWRSVLCQRLVVEMDSILVLFFFEVRIANSSISSDKDKRKKNSLRAEQRQDPNTAWALCVSNTFVSTPVASFPAHCQQNRFCIHQPSSPCREI